MKKVARAAVSAVSVLALSTTLCACGESSDGQITDAIIFSRILSHLMKRAT